MIQTAPAFTDHMVLQRDKNVAVFGTGTAGESVRVSLPAQNRTVSGCVGGDGTWCVYLPTLTAGIGMTLEVAGAENQLVYTDVAVGEVWLAGGQSNMEFMLKDAKGGAEHCSTVRIRCALFPCATEHISPMRHMRRNLPRAAGSSPRRKPLACGRRWRTGQRRSWHSAWRSGGNRRLQLWRFFCQLLDAGGGSRAARCRTSLSERLSGCRRRKDGCGDDRCL